MFNSNLTQIDIEKELDQHISNTLFALKVQAVAQIIQKLEKQEQMNLAQPLEFEFSIHEKHMRRDFSYNPKSCFDHAFYAHVQSSEHSDNTLDFKDELKPFFMFAMKYLPTRLDLGISFDMSEFNSNVFLNHMVEQGFFNQYDSIQSYSDTLSFASVIVELDKLGLNTSAYSLEIKPQTDSTEQANADRLALYEAIESNPIEKKEALFEALNQIPISGRVHKM